MDRIIVHTNWTNTVSEKHSIELEELRDANKRDLLRWAFTAPERLKPEKTIDALTRDAADKFAQLAITLRDRGHDPQQVAHFINRLVFCMFAEDINLLPRKLFRQICDKGFLRPVIAQGLLEQLFTAMKQGGLFGVDEIEWFNGGLFDDASALPVTRDDLRIIGEAATLDWSDIDPSIFGTLFERGLDPSKRSQLGAHYTDPDKIMMIVRPVIIDPLWREWEAAKADMAKPRASGKRRQELFSGFLERLRTFRVLDPACGSGNFLYIALLSLKDIEHRVNLEAEAMGFGRQFPTVTPQVVRGIEINPYAAELARITVWIGEIQWMRKNGYDVDRKPILKPLKHIECRDAVLNKDGTEAAWPPSDVIVGNPPFLGDREHRVTLGEAYTLRLRAAYAGRVAGRADLVVYWFDKAARKILSGDIKAFGFVATKSIAKGASRAPLDLLTPAGQPHIFNAWTNEPWVVEGAAVRVSIVCAAASSYRSMTGTQRYLNGREVAAINPDLSTGIDVTKAKKLPENARVAFQGVKLTGPFDITGAEARQLLQRPLNPNGRSNGDVVARLYDIDDIVGRDSDRWVVDFATGFSESEAALYELPFRVVKDRVVPFRSDPEQCRSDEGRLKNRYWEFQRPRPELRQAASGKPRVIVTPESSEHRIFVFVPQKVLLQGSLFCITRDDYLTFGVLCSRIHEVWATAQGNRLGVGNQRRYNIGVAFETFPFPAALTPNLPAANYASDPRATPIAEAAEKLDSLREAWLNPPDLVKHVSEVVAGFPDRIMPVSDAAAAELKKRTLTNLYNQRPTWLDNAHKALDAAVAAAYGWSTNLSDDEVLARLLALNAQRAAVP
jgi:type II restriction/modification system DNA methylase subunit YeeA